MGPGFKFFIDASKKMDGANYMPWTDNGGTILLCFDYSKKK